MFFLTVTINDVLECISIEVVVSIRTRYFVVVLLGEEKFFIRTFARRQLERSVERHFIHWAANCLVNTAWAGFILYDVLVLQFCLRKTILGRKRSKSMRGTAFWMWLSGWGIAYYIFKKFRIFLHFSNCMIFHDVANLQDGKFQSYVHPTNCRSNLSWPK